MGMRTDFRSRRGGLGALLALLVAFGLPCSVADEPQDAAQDAADTVVVFVVRHTEKAKDGSKDPDLTEAGRRRAEELASLLGQSGLTHLYSSEFRRTRETVGPLARASA